MGHYDCPDCLRYYPDCKCEENMGKISIHNSTTGKVFEYEDNDQTRNAIKKMQEHLADTIETLVTEQDEKYKAVFHGHIFSAEDISEVIRVGIVNIPAERKNDRDRLFYGNTDTVVHWSFKHVIDNQNDIEEYVDVYLPEHIDLISFVEMIKLNNA